MEAGLKEFMREQGCDTTSSSDQRSAKRSTQRPRKSASKAGKDRRQAVRKPRQFAGKAGRVLPLPEDEQKAIKKVERLDKIAEELRQGGHFSITRLTTLEGLCEDPKAAGGFALFLSRKIQERMREKETPRRYRELVNRAVWEIKPYLDDPTEERKERLFSLFHEIEAEQNEYQHISWGMVRIVKSMDLIVVEHCLRAVLRSYEASFWLYQAARDYTGHTDVLERLGLHVSNQRIVAELARLGIEVHEDQVEMVRIERLKDTASTGRGLAYVPRTAHRSSLYQTPKTPPRHH